MFLEVQLTFISGLIPLFYPHFKKIFHWKYCSGYKFCTMIQHHFQVHLDAVLLNFQTLHHFFFVLCKLIKEGNSCRDPIAGGSRGVLNVPQFSSRGGFLRQPVINLRKDDLNSSVVNSTVWEKFCCSISEMAWPSVKKCLAEGKAFKDDKIAKVNKRVIILWL